MKFRNALQRLSLSYDIRTMSAPQIRDHLLRGDQPAVKTFAAAAARVISEKSNKKTQLIYTNTTACVERFAGKGLLITDITPAWLRRFSDDLAARGFTISTRSIHLRNIRSIFNATIDDRLIGADLYPFRSFRIPASHKTVESLSREELLRVFDHVPAGPAAELARDLFMLSFFMCGMNRIDLFYLKQLDRGRAVFVRRKTSSKNDDPVSIAVQPEAAEIFEKYRGRTHALRFIEQMRDYETFNDCIQHAMQRMKRALDLPRLTFYSARYTWATMADALGINEKEIRKGLGHADRSIAGKHYIAYDWRKVDVANRQVIDQLRKVDY